MRKDSYKIGHGITDIRFGIIDVGESFFTSNQNFILNETDYVFSLLYHSISDVYLTDKYIAYSVLEDLANFNCHICIKYTKNN